MTMFLIDVLCGGVTMLFTCIIYGATVTEDKDIEIKCEKGKEKNNEH